MVEALRQGKRDHQAIPKKEQDLLKLVEKITLNAYKTTDEDIQNLRQVGWDDQQIAEAVYITSIFAFFNRVADSFGLQDPGYEN